MSTDAAQPRLRALATSQLTPGEVAAIRELLWAAFDGDKLGAFSEADWEHARGGTHFVLDIAGTIVCHAAVVERRLHVGGHPLRAGYVEAVATLPSHRGKGHATGVMRAVNAHIGANFEIGALGTGSQSFYQRLGWRTWRGPSSVSMPDGQLERTPDEDGYIMVLPMATVPPLDMLAPINCEWRAGDVW